MDVNLFVVIQRFNKWGDMAAWLCTSKKIREFFLKPEIICECIKFHIKCIKENNVCKLIEKLPKWMYCSLRYTPPFMKEIPQVINNELDKYNINSNTPQFITGGFVSQQVHGLYWVSDIDIWKNIEDENIDEKESNVINIDYVYRKERIETCISEFDLSCCMSGVLGNDIYCTPLFLYGYYTNSIIVALKPLSINYLNTLDGYEYKLDLVKAFNKHVKFHDTIAIHNCYDCKCLIDGRNCAPNENHIIRWFNRVNKYCVRFMVRSPTLIYTESPQTFNPYNSDKK